MAPRTRSRRLSTAQVRASTKPEGIVVAYASVFHTEYDVGGTRERIAPGAFADSIAERDAWAFHLEHGWRRGEAPIGVIYRATEDAKGLKIEARLYVDDDPRARTVYRSITDGALREYSIGFLPTEEAHLAGGKLVEVRKAELLEVSAVFMGANPDTATVGVRTGYGDRPDLDLSDPRHRALLREHFERKGRL